MNPTQSNFILDDAVKTLRSPSGHFGILRMNFFVMGIIFLFICSFSVSLIKVELQGPLKNVSVAFLNGRSLLSTVFLFVLVLPALYRSAYKITSPIEIWSNIKPLVYAFVFANVVKILYSLYMSKFTSDQQSGEPFTVWEKAGGGTEGYCSTSNILQNRGASVECGERSSIRKFLDSLLDTTNTVSDAVIGSLWFSYLTPGKVGVDGGIQTADTNTLFSILAVLFGLIQRASMKSA